MDDDDMDVRMVMVLLVVGIVAWFAFVWWRVL